MKNTPFLLLLLGIVFIWLGLTGRLGAVLAALFEPGKLTGVGSSSPSTALPSIPSEGKQYTPYLPPIGGIHGGAGWDG